MTAVLMTPPYMYFTDDDGEPLSGGKIWTYAAGTAFSTPKATYTTAAGDTENTNPIVLDSSGRAVVFINGSYGFKITDANDVTIRTVDNVTSFDTLPDESDAFFQSFSGDGSTTVFTLSESLGTEEKAIFVYVNAGLQNCATNGTFATDTGWTKGAGWTIAAGVADAAGAISTAISQTAGVTLVEGQEYVVTFTITRSAGGLIPSVGGTDGTERTSTGTYSQSIIAGSTQIIAFTGNGFTGTLDNVTVTQAVSSGFQIQSPTAFTLSGTSLTFATAPPSGTGNIYVFAPSLLVGAASSAAAAAQAAEAGALAAQEAAETAQANSETAEANAETAEANAEAAAALSLSYAQSYSGTSTTSLAIGTGAKVFTTQSGKLWVAGQFLQIASDASAVNYMHGTVTSYSGSTLTMNITDIGGSGTFADWTISISGTQGTQGVPGGPLSDGDYGDITVSSSGTVMTIDNAAVTFAKIQNLAANSFLARPSSATGTMFALTLGASQLAGRGSTGDLDAITLGSGLAMTGTVLDTTAAIPTAASQAEQETGTDTTVFVTPGRQQYHPSSCKAWALVAGTGSITTSYNCSSWTDSATGSGALNFTVSFSSSNYACVVGSDTTGSSSLINRVDPTTTSRSAGAIGIFARNNAGSAVDPNNYHIACYGDQ